MTWVPQTDFEEEIVSLQPDHNFIFGSLCDTDEEVAFPRPESHIKYAKEQKQRNEESKKSLPTDLNHKSKKLQLIGEIQRIAGTKPLGEQPTLEDWDNNDNLERETIAMLRHYGVGPSIEQPLSKNTIATLPITENVSLMKYGNKTMPIFFDDKYFKLKPEEDTNVLELLSNENSDSNGEKVEKSNYKNPLDKVISNFTSIKTEPISPKLNETNDKDDMTSCDSSLNNLSLDADESLPSTSDENYIRSRSWRNRKYSLLSSSSSTSSNIYNTNRNGDHDNSNFGSTNKKDRRQKKQIFYTNKELYDKKRCNQAQ